MKIGRNEGEREREREGGEEGERERGRRGRRERFSLSDNQHLY